jgi:ABC-type glycerol-3-phosphate transport system permease component
MAARVTRQSDRLVGPVTGRIIIVVLGVIVAVPVLYMLILSVSPQFAILSGQLIPSTFAFDNYIKIWTAAPLAAGFVNSLFVCGTAAVLTVLVASMAAYPIARYTFIGRSPILFGALGLQLLPGPMILLPLFVLFASIQTFVHVTIIGSYWGLIITYLTFSLPLSLWLMVNYIAGIPRELEEAVFVDGGGHIDALRRVVLPLALPGMVVAFLFALLAAWNDVLFATVLTNNDTRTLAVDLSNFTLTQEGAPLPMYSELMAAAAVTAAPIVIIYLALQRFLVSGLGAGALK